MASTNAGAAMAMIVDEAGRAERLGADDEPRRAAWNGGGGFQSPSQDRGNTSRRPGRYSLMAS